mgnify:CR=1 FL=1
MNPYQLVVFDMAGTTVTDRHEVESCFATAAAETGLSVSAERILAMQGMAKRHVFDTLWTEQLGTGHDELTRHVDHSYLRFTEVLETHYLTRDITPTTGCLETFAFLREQGIAIALTTGLYRKVTDIVLQKFGWLEGLNAGYVGTKQSVIQVSIASDEVPRGRPEPLMIQKAMYLLGVTNPAAVVNIGDTPSDLLSGRAAGVGLNLGVTNGTHSREQLLHHPHDQLIGSLAELSALIVS